MSGYRHCKHCGSIAHTSRKCPYRETAKKEAMVLEAEKRGFRPDTDNAADALAVAAYGIAKERA